MASRTLPAPFGWGQRWSFSTWWSAAALFSAFLVLVGAWLPWTSSKIVDVFNEAYAIGAGIQPFDIFVILVPVIFAVGAIVLTWGVPDWRPDLLLVATAVPILYFTIETWKLQMAGQYFATEPGVHVTVAGGCLLGSVGLYSIALRIRSGAAMFRRLSWRRVSERARPSALASELKLVSDRGVGAATSAWVRANPSRGWSAAALFASLLALVGAVSMYSTVSGFVAPAWPSLTIGGISIERFVIVPALVAAAAVVLTHPFSDWRPDFLLVFTAVPILYYSYRSVSWMGGLPQASDQLGLYLVIAGGCLLAIGGLTSIFFRLSPGVWSPNQSR